MNLLQQLSELQNVLFLLMASIGVFFMQAGFCFLETGAVRSKNSVNVAIKNFSDFCLTSLAFWCVGFAIMYSPSLNFDAIRYLFFSEQSAALVSFFVFQLVYCGTASTIMSGAVAERTTFIGYLVISLFIAAVVYPVFGRLVWNGILEGQSSGWLTSLGYYDFAGASVVHSIGGWAALAAAIVIGPRVGRFGENSQKIKGHNVPMSTIGALILWLGWFGFNAGSNFAMNEKVPLIILNTCMAGAAGAASTLVIGTYIYKADVRHLLNGALTGLVGVTSCCNAIAVSDAVIIGLVAGGLYYISSYLIEKLKIDDVVNAVSVHAMGGLWGIISVALFADPAIIQSNLSFSNLLGVQLLGAAICAVWGFSATYLFLTLIKRIVPLRVSVNDEISGLNWSEHDESNDAVDLLVAMQKHKIQGDYNERVFESPNTEFGEIAKEYNYIVEKVNEEMKIASEKAEQLAQSYKALQNAQSQLVESDRMAALGGLVAGVAKEIDSPVDLSMQAASSLLVEMENMLSQISADATSHASIHKFIKTTKNNVLSLIENLDRTSTLVKSFKQVSNEESVHEVKEIELGSYVRKVLNNLHLESFEHKVIVNCPEPISCETYAGAIGQIITNLVMNAFIHAFEHLSYGELTITMVLNEQNEIVITVEDNGSGIAVKHIGRVFEPFYTTNRSHGSSGLGLHVVQNLVNKTLEGSINCKSSEQLGTTFTIVLPYMHNA